MIRFITVFLVILATTPCFSQVKSANGNSKMTVWKKNGITICDSQGRSTKQNARIANLDDGSTVIVWEDTRNGYTDIFAQRFDSSGAKLWGESGIAVCKMLFNQTFPQIINAGKNQAIITWQDYRNEYSDIYAQKVNVEGRTLWGKDGIPVCKATANQLDPQIASDGSGGAIITWYDYRSGKGEDIYAQKISGTGSPEWQLDGIPVCVEPATQWYPQIISDGSGGAVICWDDKRSGYYDIYVQRLDPQGASLWPMNGIAICSAPENQEYCQIASTEGGTFTAAWQDYRNGNADAYAQKLDMDGKILWKINGIPVCNVVGNQEKPQIVGGQDPVIVWTDFRNGTGNSDIFCQKVSSAGNLLWDPIGNPVCEAPGNQGNPRICPDGSGGIIAAWQDQRGTSSAIFARKINKDGRAVWVPDGKTICNVKDSAEFPQVSLSKNGNAIIAWQDKRYGGLDLFVQSVSNIGMTNWRNNGVDVAIAYGSVTQQKPKITKSGKGEYIAVFEDYRNGFSNIYAQKFNNYGKLLWDREGIRICMTTSNQLNPEIVSDDDGGAIIVWEDSKAGFSQVYAQRVDLYGNLLWDENGILICQVEKDKKNPRIAKDTKSGAFIIWQDFRNSDDFPDIYGQRIDKNGSLLWGDDGVGVNKVEGSQANIKVDPDGEGGCVVTWVDYRKNINTPDIYAQKLSGNGRLIWEIAGLAVCRAPESQRNQNVATDGDIIIVWEDSGGGNYDIYAQKINKDGSVAWVCDGIPVCTAPFTQHEPKVINDGKGGAIITWEDYRNANWDIFTQRIDDEGKCEWEKDGVKISTAGGTQYSPKIVRSKDSSSIIVWEDYRNNKSYNIYSQMISGKGETLWGDDGIAVCSTDGGARNPEITDDNDGGAVIVWTDYRFGSYDIYAQRINEDQGK